jgi:hypothetical protein
MHEGNRPVAATARAACSWTRRAPSEFGSSSFAALVAPMVDQLAQQKAGGLMLPVRH